MFLEQLMAFEQLVGIKLEQLEAQIDTHALYHLLQPIGVLANRMEQALDLHILFHVLLDGIEGALEECQAYSTRLDQGETMTQLELDALLDLCDELADQIDEQESYQAARQLVARYKALVTEIGKLQDKLEGL